MRRLPDVPVFIGKVVAYSVALTALVWMVPSLRGVFYPRNSLIVVPVVSVILSARAVSWQRKLVFVGVILGTFVAIDFVFTATGLAAFAWASLATGFAATALGVAYMVFAQAFPLVMLLVFVGDDASILWARPPSAQAQTSSETANGAPTRERKRRAPRRSADAASHARRHGKPSDS
jgi:hypothetical protein